MYFPGCRTAFEEQYAAVMAQEGETIRLTYASGFQVTGLVEKCTVGAHELVRIGGELQTGELAGFTKLEVKGASGRYAEVTG